MDSETTTRIIDPYDPGARIAVRILFDLSSSPSDPFIYGVFRLSDDSEIDYHALPHYDQDRIYSAVEQQITAETSR